MFSLFSSVHLTVSVRFSSDSSFACGAAVVRCVCPSTTHWSLHTRDTGHCLSSIAAHDTSVYIWYGTVCVGPEVTAAAAAAAAFFVRVCSNTVRDRATEIGVSGASQPISNGLLRLIRGNHIVISVLLSEIEELESRLEFFTL